LSDSDKTTVRRLILKQGSKKSKGDALEFGKMLGRRQTFSLVAGKCTAADAECLKKTRDQKLYLGYAKSWEECCTKHIGMSRANAERVIGLLEEFGPAYFEVAQLTRVSPETFRQLAPSIHDGALDHQGEAIALISENAARVASVVGEHRKAAASPRTVDTPVGTRLDALEGRCNRLLEEFEELSCAWRDNGDRLMLGSVLARTRSELERLGLELGA
jgi:hypothetical protein